MFDRVGLVRRRHLDKKPHVYIMAKKTASEERARIVAEKAAEREAARLTAEKAAAEKAAAEEASSGGRSSKPVAMLSEDVLRMRLRPIFDRFDADGSGEISVAELRAVVKMMKLDMTPAELDELHREADTDGSGEIGFEEFVSALAKQGGSAGGASFGGIVTNASSAFGFLNPFSWFAPKEKAPAPKRKSPKPKVIMPYVVRGPVPFSGGYAVTLEPKKFKVKSRPKKPPPKTPPKPPPAEIPPPTPSAAPAPAPSSGAAPAPSSTAPEPMPKARYLDFRAKPSRNGESQNAPSFVPRKAGMKEPVGGGKKKKAQPASMDPDISVPLSTEGHVQQKKSQAQPSTRPAAATPPSGLLGVPPSERSTSAAAKDTSSQAKPTPSKASTSRPWPTKHVAVKPSPSKTSSAKTSPAKASPASISPAIASNRKDTNAKEATEHPTSATPAAPVTPARGPPSTPITAPPRSMILSSMERTPVPKSKAAHRTQELAPRGMALGGPSSRTTPGSPPIAQKQGSPTTSSTPPPATPAISSPPSWMFWASDTPPAKVSTKRTRTPAKPLQPVGIWSKPRQSSRPPEPLLGKSSGPGSTGYLQQGSPSR